MIIPKMAMETVNNGAKAVSKFEEIVLKFCGSSLTRKQADADMYAAEKQIELIRSNPDMNISFIGGQMNIQKRELENLVSCAQYREIMKLLRQEKNLENIEAKTTGFLESNTEEVSDVPVDEDWIARFMNIAQDISSEEMQQVWAKILADEIIAPGSFSLRTLDVVRNISSVEANLFVKILPLALKMDAETMAITSNYNTLEKYGLRYLDIRRLLECGLIDVHGAECRFSISKENKQSISNKDKIIVICSDDDNLIEVSLGMFRFTVAGMELLNALEYVPNDEYFAKCAETIFNQDKRLRVSIHSIVSKDEKKVSYNPTPLKVFCTKKEIV